MFILNTADPLNVLLILAVSLLLILFGKETKRSVIPQIVLFAHLGILVWHAVQLATLDPQYYESIKIVTKSLAIDFSMILISFISYLWVDDIEAKAKKKKSIDNSLEWFWKKV